MEIGKDEKPRKHKNIYIYMQAERYSVPNRKKKKKRPRRVQ